jgi:hypothetical protein
MEELFAAPDPERAKPDRRSKSALLEKTARRSRRYLARSTKAQWFG